MNDNINNMNDNINNNMNDNIEIKYCNNANSSFNIVVIP